MMLSQVDPLSIALLLTALTLLPLGLICTTCFLKVSVVLMIVRNSIGVQQVPPSMAMNAIALSITLFVMAPALREMAQVLPFSTSTTSKDLMQSRGFSIQDMAKVAEPLRRFMLRNTVPEGRARFLQLAKRQGGAGATDLKDSDYTVLIPSFVISELQIAFEVGFMLYVPMVVIDLLLSNLLLALGMQMVSPMVLSIPLKLLLFVMLDGWTRLFEGLVQSYAGAAA